MLPFVIEVGNGHLENDALVVVILGDDNDDSKLLDSYANGDTKWPALEWSDKFIVFCISKSVFDWPNVELPNIWPTDGL